MALGDPGTGSRSGRSVVRGLPITVIVGKTVNTHGVRRLDVAGLLDLEQVGCVGGHEAVGQRLLHRREVFLLLGAELG